MRILFLISAMLWSTQAHAFDSNMSSRDLMRIEYGYMIGDLMVGDKAYVTSHALCVENGKLMLSKIGRTMAKDDFFSNFIASVLPGNMVSLELHKEIDKEKNTRELIPRYGLCQNKRDRNRDLNLGFFKVKDINGFDNMRDYIRYLKAEGAKFAVDPD